MANRIIKFRFWNKKDYGSNGDSFYQPANSMVEWENAKDDPNKWINFEDENVLPMQFTGLKDKNGKEIYEGDILRDIEGIISEVKYKGRRFCAVAKDGFDSLEDPDENEVIGNIYQNPELINN